MNQNKLEGIIEGIFHLKPILFRRFVNPVLTNASVTMGSQYVLSALLKSGQLTMSNLSRKISIPKPNLTAIIDRMIEQGLVVRLTDEKDRRKVMVALTDAGIRKSDEIREGIKETMRNQLSFLSDEDIDELYQALNTLREILGKIEN